MLYDRAQSSRLLYTIKAGAYRSSPIEPLRSRIVTSTLKFFPEFEELFTGIRATEEHAVVPSSRISASLNYTIKGESDKQELWSLKCMRKIMKGQKRSKVRV